MYIDADCDFNNPIFNQCFPLTLIEIFIISGAEDAVGLETMIHDLFMADIDNQHLEVLLGPMVVNYTKTKGFMKQPTLKEDLIQEVEHLIAKGT